MYVCVCHALRCRDVEQASKQGVRRVAELHRHFGVKAQCGRCVPCIRDMLSSERKDNGADDWAAAGALA